MQIYVLISIVLLIILASSAYQKVPTIDQGEIKNKKYFKANGKLPKIVSFWHWLCCAF